MLRNAPQAVEFGKSGQAPNESFVAQVRQIELPPTRSPEEFESMIRVGAMRDAGSTRFSHRHSEFRYSTERGYPCVRGHSMVDDNAPRSGGQPLLLQSETLYCRHPVRPSIGFAVLYSRRGASAYPNLVAEANVFFDSVKLDPE